MKKQMIVATISICLAFSGCGNSGISSDDYSAVLNEKNSLATQVEQLTSEKEQLSSEKEDLQKEYDEYKEKMQEYEGLADAEKEAREIEAQKIAEEKKAEEERLAAEEEERKLQEEKAGYETGITYDQLARTPDDYKGEKVKFSGKVVQVMEGDGETQIRFAVDSDYDKMIYCGYDSSIVSSRVLEGDIITIYGISLGLISYESTMGASITIPAVQIDKIDQ